MRPYSPGGRFITLATGAKLKAQPPNRHRLQLSLIHIFYDVVGPVCETSDFLGKQRELAIAEGDYIAQRSAGAYGASMSSNYNSRPRTAEVLVDGDKAHLIRRRENLSELWALESIAK